MELAVGQWLDLRLKQKIRYSGVRGMNDGLTVASCCLKELHGDRNVSWGQTSG